MTILIILVESSINRKLDTRTMTEKVRMIRDIHNFVRGKMDWESAIDLLGRVSKSEEWIDYLLMEMHSTTKTTLRPLIKDKDVG